ncbi:hypothetical protein BSFA1_61720 (plasmid) [Burkholderia sp. SFA1]|nr:hypothetical protein BSFA1_61720 [Burkholderia sp. SFA1]
MPPPALDPGEPSLPRPPSSKSTTDDCVSTDGSVDGDMPADKSAAATVIAPLRPTGAHPSEDWLLQGIAVVCADAKLAAAAAITIALSLITVFKVFFLGLLMCAPFSLSSSRAT